LDTRRSLLVSRRQIVRSLLATGAFGITSRLWTGCTPAPNQSNQATAGGGATASPDNPMMMGFIYVGPKDDFGYNQAHFEGKEGLAKLAWLKTVEEASVPETTAVEETMLNMINQDGATVLFPTSFGYFDPHILKLARENPQVQLFHFGGL